MFDSFFNVIFIFIIIVIFIGRTFAEAKKKKKAPPPPPRPRVEPLHFEEKEEEDALEFLKSLAAQGTRSAAAAKPLTKTAEKARKTQAPDFAAQTANTFSFISTEDTSLYKTPSVTEPKPAPAKGTMRTVSQGQAGFALNLNHLSPLKQAVVMAEILGPPKGMI